MEADSPSPASPAPKEIAAPGSAVVAGLPRADADGPEAKLSTVHWVGKGLWGVVDQGLFAGANFLVNVFLVRRLPNAQRDYGAFTVALTIFLLLAVIHACMLIEPMTIFGPGRYRDRIRAYFAALVAAHWVSCLPLMLLLAGAGVVCSNRGADALAVSFFGFAIACPFILFAWLMRRACYVLLASGQAAIASFIYLSVIVVGLLVIPCTGVIYVMASILTMGVAGLVAGAWLVLRLRPAFGQMGGGFLRAAALEHWRYGRWATGSGVVYFITGQIFFLVLPLGPGGMAASGALRALYNLIQPLTLLMGGVLSLAGPMMVRAHERGTLRRLVMRLAIPALLVGLLYWLMLGALHRPLFAIIYRGRFTEFSNLLWIFGLVPPLGALADIFGGALRARQRPDRVFLAYAVAAAIGGGGGTLLALEMGLKGAVIGALACAGLATGLLLLLEMRQKDRVVR